jgi:lipopolysaccharide/colanic/teichoic acid biosynthesis glycosyltransferase
VLRGEMSLVGPRMITPEELDRYGQQRLSLHTVKPGITGLWQVSGRSDLSYEERVRIDMYYVRNYSLWLDLQILFVQTLPAVLNRRGAY